MKVLMLGWEFPPHISGGLGTACFGLTQGLSHHGVDVLFVVPRAHGDEDARFTQILGANQIVVEEEIEQPPERRVEERTEAWFDELEEDFDIADEDAVHASMLHEAALHEDALHEAALHDTALHEAALHDDALHDDAGHVEHVDGGEGFPAFARAPAASPATAQAGGAWPRSPVRRRSVPGSARPNPSPNESSHHAADARLRRTFEILAVDSLLAPYMTNREYVARFEHARDTARRQHLPTQARHTRRLPPGMAEEHAPGAHRADDPTGEGARTPTGGRADPRSSGADTHVRSQTSSSAASSSSSSSSSASSIPGESFTPTRAPQRVTLRRQVPSRRIVREEQLVPRKPLVRRRVFEFSGVYGPDLMQEVGRYAEAVEEIARHRDFDVIHAHDWMSIPAGLAAARASKKPLVLHIHASEADRSGDRPNTAVQEIEQLGLDGADRVVCVSHYTAAQLRRHYRVDEAKVRIVHNALTQKEQKERVKLVRAIDSPIVLFLGRVTFQKGPEYFLEAALRVARLRPDVKFVIAGSGDMLPATIESVARMGLARHVHFTGFLTGEDVERMYAMADVYVMPSVSEPFGITPLEAMALDVPVILSRQSGVSEVLRSALKVDFWDVADIANKILAVLTYPALTEALREEGREEVRAMRWEIPAGLVRDTYRELVGTS